MRRAHRHVSVLSTASSSRPAPTPSTSAASPPTTPEPAALRAWSLRWGTPDELLLLAASHREAEQLNRLARSALTAAGRLGGPTVRAGELDLAPGDRVVAGAGGIGRPGGRGIPEGCPGDVRMVEAAGRSMVVDFPTAGVVRLTGSQLQKARLRYGYAIPAPPGFGIRMGDIRLGHPAELGLEVGDQ
ncbi:MAG: hypothetical protein ACRDY7_16320 [Acidimicrobiia bacterium]